MAVLPGAESAWKWLNFSVFGFSFSILYKLLQEIVIFYTFSLSDLKVIIVLLRFNRCNLSGTYLAYLTWDCINFCINCIDIPHGNMVNKLSMAYMSQL